MTEHYTESADSANAWPLALDVGKEIHDCMAANFSAYIWWYIRRSYGPITDDGKVSKRGYLMAQYAKFIRPGFRRVQAVAKQPQGIQVTAYKKEGRIVIVAVNTGMSPRTASLALQNGFATSFEQYTTSGTKNLQAGAAVPVTDYMASFTIDAQSVTTLVSGTEI